MTDKYRDNKRDGVASDYVYGDVPSVEKKAKTTSIKSIIRIFLICISIVSISVNVFQFNQNSELKTGKFVSNSEIKKLNKKLIANSEKIDTLTEKVNIQIELLKINNLLLKKAQK